MGTLFIVTRPVLTQPLITKASVNMWEGWGTDGGRDKSITLPF